MFVEITGLLVITLICAFTWYKNRYKVIFVGYVGDKTEILCSCRIKTFDPDYSSSVSLTQEGLKSFATIKFIELGIDIKDYDKIIAIVPKVMTFELYTKDIN